MPAQVSIITVAYNSSATIEDSILSVLNQDYGNIEHIIIDGKSNDGTTAIIQQHLNKIAIYLSEPDNGIYDAMNKGIKLSSGDIIATLNADDVYADQTIVSQMVEFIQNNGLDAAYGDLVYIDHNNSGHVTRFWKAGEYKKGAFCHGWVIPHPTFFCRKQVFEKYGYFNSSFQIAADFELMLRFIEKHQIKVGYLPKVIVNMRTGGRANILQGIIRGNWEIIKSFRLNGLRLSPWLFILKPITKISQLFTRPGKLNSNNIDL
jgi:glycosyltransferase involved in cell wall biosynthesis